MSIHLLEGAYDLHVHTAPDVVERKFDDLELAERFAKIGMKGFVIKSHYFVTSGRARLVNKVHPNINAVGAITLNNSVGGISPLSVELAARDGAKLVWMPTFDSKNEQDYFLKKDNYEKLPYWAKLQLELKEKGVAGTDNNITTLNENGTLKDNCLEVLEVIKANNMILATGHLGKEEIFALVKQANKMELKKIIVTHPTFPSINLSKEEQKELTNLGAYMEYNFSLIKPRFGLDWNQFYENINYIGPKHCVLSTDTGQPYNPYPDEGLEIAVKNLLDNGFKDNDIRHMSVENTTYLVEG